MEKKDRLIAVGLFIFSFLVYFFTLCPTVYMGDSGELITVVYRLGIAHPTGFPLYILLGKLFTIIFPFGSIAYRLNIFSAVFASLTVSVLYKILRVLNLKRISCIGASLIFAFSFTLWSQAIIARIYTLNIFLISLILLFAFKWGKTKEIKYIYLICFILGLGFGTHLAIVLCIPFLLYFVWTSTSLHTFCKKDFFICLGLFLIPFLQYLYIPLRSRMDPVIDWGNPETFKQFLSYITQREFAEKMFARTFVEYFKTTGIILKYIIFDSLFVGVIIGLLGIIKPPKNYSYPLKPRNLFISLGLIIFFNILMMLFYGYKGDIQIIWRYFIPSYLVISIFCGFGLEKISQLFYNFKINYLLSAAIIILISLIPFSFNFYKNNLRNYYLAYDYNYNILNSIEENSILITQADRITFPIWYLKYVENIRPDVVDLSKPALSHLYYLEQLESYYPQIIPDDLKNYPTSEERILKIIVENYNKFPIYVTFNTGLILPPGYFLYQQGLVYRILKEEDFDIFAYHQKIQTLLANYKFRGKFQDYFRDEDVETKMTFSDLVGSYINMGVIYANNGWYEEAIKIYQQGLKINPENKDLQFNLGKLYLDLGLMDEAEFLLGKKLEKQEATMQNEVLIQQALIFYQNKRYTEAIDLFKQLAEIMPEENYRFYNNIGLCYYKIGDYENAKKYYQQCISINKDYPVVYYNLGLVYEKENLIEKAILSYQKALELNPNYLEVQQKLEKLTNQ